MPYKYQPSDKVLDSEKWLTIIDLWSGANVKVAVSSESIYSGSADSFYICYLFLV